MLQDILQVTKIKIKVLKNIKIKEIKRFARKTFQFTFFFKKWGENGCVSSCLHKYIYMLHSHFFFFI